MKKCLFFLVAILFWATSLQAAINFDAKPVIINGKNFIRTVNGQVRELIPISSITQKRVLNSEEIIRANTITKQVLDMGSGIPASYSLAANQSPIKDQHGRGTCWIFAVTAGMEAAYKKKYGTIIDLSEQYFQHVAKSTGVAYPKYYKYENQSSYWNGGNSWAASETAQNYTIPLETFAPYLSSDQMNALRVSIPAAGALEWKSSATDNIVTQAQVDAFEYADNYINLNARKNAKYGINAVTLLDSSKTRDTAFLEGVIYGGKEVAVDFDIKWKYNAATDVLEYDSTSAGGGHVMLVIGYNRTNHYFILKNSWGGVNYIKVSYEFMQKASYGGAIVDDVRDPNLGTPAKSLWIGKWNMDHDGWHGVFIIRRITDRFNTPTRLGTYFAQDGKAYSVNGKFTNDGRGMIYYIDFAHPGENAPGSLVGQNFNTYVYSWDNVFSAGTTVWNSIPFGTFLTRNALPPVPYSNNFNMNEWIGTWNMNHDGWKGILKINSLSGYNISGQYTLNGKTYALTGTIDSAKKHNLNLKIYFEGNTQPFSLYYHTWEDKFFSGLTTWNGSPFGVHAVKN